MQKSLVDGVEPHETCSRCFESLMASAQLMWEKIVVSELRAEGGRSEGKRAKSAAGASASDSLHCTHNFTSTHSHCQ